MSHVLGKRVSSGLSTVEYQLEHAAKERKISPERSTEKLSVSPSTLAIGGPAASSSSPGMIESIRTQMCSMQYSLGKILDFRPASQSAHDTEDGDEIDIDLGTLQTESLSSSW
jgi:hypothetical protein